MSHNFPIVDLLVLLHQLFILHQLPSNLCQLLLLFAIHKWWSTSCEGWKGFYSCLS
jgi:hypothetical protein